MLSAVGVYDVQAVYTETRPTIALALQAAGNGAAADERRIEQVLMHFAVVPGPPQNVKIKPIKGSSHGAASCNNTRNLIALQPADFFLSKDAKPVRRRQPLVDCIASYILILNEY